jgi:hypothetical protein
MQQILNTKYLDFLVNLQTKYKAKQDARESALKKLAEIAGLTEEELASIL